MTSHSVVLAAALLGAVATSPALAQSVVAPVTVDPAIVRLQERVDDLERQLRQATGENERLQRERDVARADAERFEKMVNDLLAQQAAAAAAPPPEPAPAPKPAPKPTPKPAPAVKAAEPAPAPQTAPAAAPTTASEGAAAPAGVDPAAAYRAIRMQLMRGDTAGAETGLRQWIAQYPNDGLAPEAKFWLGQTLLGRAANDEAAKVFVELLRSHPKASVAPEAMGRLGVALTRMGQKAQGCAAFADIARRYPTAAPAVKARADDEARKAGCPAG